MRIEWSEWPAGAPAEQPRARRPRPAVYHPLPGQRGGGGDSRRHPWRAKIAGRVSAYFEWNRAGSTRGSRMDRLSSDLRD